MEQLPHAEGKAVLELQDGAVMAWKHLGAKGALTIKARVKVLNLFLAGAPAEIRNAFCTKLEWREESGTFGRPELDKLASWRWAALRR